LGHFENKDSKVSKTTKKVSWQKTINVNNTVDYGRYRERVTVDTQRHTLYFNTVMTLHIGLQLPPLGIDRRDVHIKCGCKKCWRIRTAQI